MTLNDGMSFSFYVYGNQYVSKGDNEPLSQTIGIADVDINGGKAPNTYGKDVFVFYITKWGVLPMGTPNETDYPLSSCRVYGFSCAAWVIAKGNMDYLHKDVSW